MTQTGVPNCNNTRQILTPCIFPFRVSYVVSVVWVTRVDSRFVPNQWETSLQSNAVSHWLGANLESALSDCCMITLTLVFCRQRTPYCRSIISHCSTRACPRRPTDIPPWHWLSLQRRTTNPWICERANRHATSVRRNRGKAGMGSVSHWSGGSLLWWAQATDAWPSQGWLLQGLVGLSLYSSLLLRSEKKITVKPLV